VTVVASHFAGLHVHEDKGEGKPRALVRCLAVFARFLTSS
jgi:hypothetical protein